MIRKNRMKDILDWSRAIIAVLILILISSISNFESKILIYIILGFLTITEIVITIIDLVIWRCPKCDRYLPRKSASDIVVCCPYCKSKIEWKN